MNNLQIFDNPEFGKVRALMINGEPWFVGADVAKALGYKNTRRALAEHIDKEDKGVTKRDTLGGPQEMTVINESGLYSLIFGSKLESARSFKRWVTSDVLPTIRKTGGYGDPRHIPTVSPAGLARLIHETRQIMLDMGSNPVEIGAMAKSVLETWGIPVPVAFSKQIPGQLCLFDSMIPRLNAQAE